LLVLLLLNRKEAHRLGLHLICSLGLIAVHLTLHSPDGTLK
jgi:hypothetical protein